MTADPADDGPGLDEQVRQRHGRIPQDPLPEPTDDQETT